MPNPADKGRPGVTVSDDPAKASKGGFVVDSVVRPDGKIVLRLFFDGHKTVVDEETAWTLVRIMVQALSAAEADALVYSAFKRLGDGDDEMAGKVLMMMRDERGRRDVAFTREHFFKRMTEGSIERGDDDG
jgi:hypothetical protein